MTFASFSYKGLDKENLARFLGEHIVRAFYGRDTYHDDASVRGLLMALFRCADPMVITSDGPRQSLEDLITGGHLDELLKKPFSLDLGSLKLLPHGSEDRQYMRYLRIAPSRVNTGLYWITVADPIQVMRRLSGTKLAQANWRFGTTMTLDTLSEIILSPKIFRCDVPGASVTDIAIDTWDGPEARSHYDLPNCSWHEDQLPEKLIVADHSWRVLQLTTLDMQGMVAGVLRVRAMTRAGTNPGFSYHVGVAAFAFND